MSDNPFERLGRAAPRTGPYSLCDSYKEKIQKSIAYYEGRYVPNVDENGNREKMIPERYLEFLRGLL